MDNFRHKGLRKKLIEEIREKGISNEDVLECHEPGSQASLYG